MTEVLSFSGNNGGSYIHDALYESYIQAKIDSEDRLAFALKENMIISEADYSNIRALQEAKISDKIKVKWQKFVAFIKNLVARFLESLSNLLLDEKDYLEKYKDIILNKIPKEGMEYSYTGNYTKAVGRLINTSIPVFNYQAYQTQLEADGDSPLVEKIMPNEFSYVDGDTLDDQLKSFFLAHEEGQKTYKFTKELLKDAYDFCYNFNRLKGIVDKDISRLNASTKAIETEVNKQLNATNSNTNTATNPQQPVNGSAQRPTDQNVKVDNNSTIFTEQDENNKQDTDKKGVTITNANAVDNMANKQITDDDKKDATDKSVEALKGQKDASEKITNASDKWIRVCRPIIAAKLTACTQIAKDYMEIIRAHVRSYGGTDKKDKTGNTNTGDPTKYEKNNQQDTNQTSEEVQKAEEENKNADQKLKQAITNRKKNKK